MVRTLEQAIAEVAALPDADQEQIGRRLLLDKYISAFRSMINAKVRSSKNPAD